MIADTRDQTALDLVRYRTSTEICAKRQDEKGVPREDRDMGPRDGVCSSLGNGGGRAGHLSSENCRRGHVTPGFASRPRNVSRNRTGGGIFVCLWMPKHLLLRSLLLLRRRRCSGVQHQVVDRGQGRAHGLHNERRI